MLTISMQMAPPLMEPLFIHDDKIITIIHCIQREQQYISPDQEEIVKKQMHPSKK